MQMITTILVIFTLSFAMAADTIEVESITLDGLYGNTNTIYPITFKNTFDEVPNFGLLLKGFQSKNPGLGSRFGWKTEVMIVDPAIAEVMVTSYSNLTRLTINYVAATSNKINIYHLNSGSLPAHTAGSVLKIPFAQISEVPNLGDSQVFVQLELGGFKAKVQNGTQYYVDVDYKLATVSSSPVNVTIPNKFSKLMNRTSPYSIIGADNFLSIIESSGSIDELSLTLFIQRAYNSSVPPKPASSNQMSQYTGTTRTATLTSTDYDYLGLNMATQPGLTSINGVSGKLRTPFGLTEQVFSIGFDPNVGNVLTSRSTIIMSRRLFAVVCDPSCTACDGPLPTDCIKKSVKYDIYCPTGFVLSSTGTCVSKCSLLGPYRVAVPDSSGNCPCIAGYKLNAKGQCVKI